MEIPGPSQPASFFAAVQQPNELYSTRPADGIGVAAYSQHRGFDYHHAARPVVVLPRGLPQLGEEGGPIRPRDVRTQPAAGRRFLRLRIRVPPSCASNRQWRKATTGRLCLANILLLPALVRPALTRDTLTCSGLFESSTSVGCRRPS